MVKNRILYSFYERICFIKLIGELRYSESNELNLLISYIFDLDYADTVFIDLRDSEYLDSTILGLLAKIAIKADEKKYNKPVIISNNENVNTILDSVGFFDIFNIVTNYENKIQELKQINSVEVRKENSLKLILEAHESLIKINETNKQTFQDVVNLLKKDTDRG